MSCTRRRFIAATAAVIVLAPLPAPARAADKLPRVGFVLNSAPLATMQGPEPTQVVMRGFVHGLRALGYVEGENIVIERRTAERELERLEDIIRGLAQLPVDVIVVTGNPMTLVAKKVTSTIPIVVAGMGNPVESGIVKSLPRPGGNITGLAPAFGVELGLKRLELIREMLPSARRIAWFGLEQEWNVPGMEEFKSAAAGMGFVMTPIEADPARIEPALERIGREHPDALYVSGTPPLFVHLRAISKFATRARVPDFHMYGYAVDAGLLASYGHDSYDIFRRAAGYVDRILKGAKPADLPVEQMSRYALVLNLKTAMALGISVPQSVRIRADRVIE